MWVNIWMFLSKSVVFVLIFFLMYIYSFTFGLKIVEPFFGHTTNQPIQNLFSGSLLATIASFLGTVLMHLIDRYVLKKNNFSSWFRSVNLVFLYVSGFGAAVVSMKELLVKENLITGNESLFNYHFSIVVLVFFIALFNYNLYNSLVLTTPREIIVLDWIQHSFRRLKRWWFRR